MIIPIDGKPVVLLNVRLIKVAIAIYSCLLSERQPDFASIDRVLQLNYEYRTDYYFENLVECKLFGKENGLISEGNIEYFTPTSFYAVDNVNLEVNIAYSLRDVTEKAIILKVPYTMPYWSKPAAQATINKSAKSKVAKQHPFKKDLDNTVISLSARELRFAIALRRTSQNGKTFNREEIKKILGIDRIDVQNYLNILRTKRVLEDYKKENIEWPKEETKISLSGKDFNQKDVFEDSIVKIGHIHSLDQLAKLPFTLKKMNISRRQTHKALG